MTDVSLNPGWRPLALVTLMAASWPAWGDDAALSYTVVPHDTLIGLGRTLLVRPGNWPEVARLNALPDPNYIVPGQVLQIPMRLLRATQVPAQLVSVEGEVTMAGQPARAGDALQPGQSLATAANSSAVLLLGDGSRVKLVPLSETTLQEHRRFGLRPNAQASAPQEGLFAATMRLVRGGIEVLAAKVRRAKPLEVTTPTAVIGVRGTEYRVHLQDGVSNTEVLEGRVRADAVGASGADVAAGFGAALKAGQAPAVVALPPAPDLSGVPARFERPLLRFTVPGETLPLRVQVAADAAFDRVLRDEWVPAGEEVRLAGLDDGVWQLRVRRVGPQGVEGFDSRREVTLKARPEPPAAMSPRANAKTIVGPVELAWARNIEAHHARLQLARDPDFAQTVQQDDALSGQSVRFELNQPGHYYWRLASVKADGDQGPWGDAQHFELRPLPEAPSGSLSADGKTLELRWLGRPEDRQQVELARDPAFEQVIARGELAEPRWVTPRPELPGTVYFRYRSVEDDGFVTPWSSTLKIEVPRGWGFLWIFLPLLGL